MSSHISIPGREEFHTNLGLTVQNNEGYRLLMRVLH